MEKQRTRESVPSTLYTEEYFLTACEGYNEFIASEGEHLSRRLDAAFALAEVVRDVWGSDRDGCEPERVNGN